MHHQIILENYGINKNKMNGDVALLPKNSMKNRINLLENDIINLDNKYIKTLKEIFQDKKPKK